MNVFLPTGEMLGIGNNRATWINTGLPDLAKNYGLRWGGEFSTGYDPIHFDFDFDREEAVAFSFQNPDINTIDVPLSPLAQDVLS